MWTEAIIEMEIDEEFFFTLTQRQFQWLRDRYKRKREYNELITCGIPTSTLANHSMCRPETPYHAFDFMPSKVDEEGQRLDDSKPKSVKKGGAGRKGKWSRKKFAKELSMLSAANFGGMFRTKTPAQPAAPSVTPTDT